MTETQSQQRDQDPLKHFLGTAGLLGMHGRAIELFYMPARR